MRKSYSQLQFEEKSLKGIVYKQDITQHDLIIKIMVDGYRKERKIWWFAYELIGHHKIKGRGYFMSYKGSTRVSELVTKGMVVSRRTIGKLNLYALIDLA